MRLKLILSSFFIFAFVGCSNVVPSISQLRSIIAGPEAPPISDPTNDPIEPPKELAKGGVVQDPSARICFRDVPDFAGALGNKIVIAGGGGSLGRCRDNPVFEVNQNQMTLTNKRFSWHPFVMTEVERTDTLSDRSILVSGYVEQSIGPDRFDILKVLPSGEVNSVLSNIDGEITSMSVVEDKIHIFGNFSRINNQMASGFAVIDGLSGEFKNSVYPFTAMEGCTNAVGLGSLTIFGGVSCRYGTFENLNSPMLGLSDLNLKQNFPSFKQINAVAQDSVTGDFFVNGDKEGDGLGMNLFRLTSSFAPVAWQPPFTGSLQFLVTLNGRLYVAGNLQSLNGTKFRLGAVDLATNTLHTENTEIGEVGTIVSLTESGGKIIVLATNGTASRVIVATPTLTGMTYFIVDGLNIWTSSFHIQGGELYWVAQTGYDYTTANSIYAIKKTSLTAYNEINVLSFKAPYIAAFSLDTNRFFISSASIQMDGKGTRNFFASIDRSSGSFAHTSDIVDGAVYSMKLRGNDLILVGGFSAAQGMPFSKIAVLNKDSLFVNPLSMNLGEFTQREDSFFAEPLFTQDTVIFPHLSLFKGNRSSKGVFAFAAGSSSPNWSLPNIMNSTIDDDSKMRVSNESLYFFDQNNKLIKVNPEGLSTTFDLQLNGSPYYFQINGQLLFLVGGFSSVLGTPRDGFAVVDLMTSQPLNVTFPSEMSPEEGYFEIEGGSVYLLHANYIYTGSSDFAIYRWSDSAWQPLNLSGLGISEVSRMHFGGGQLFLLGAGIEPQKDFGSLLLFDPINKDGSKSFGEIGGGFDILDESRPDVLFGKASPGSEFGYFIFKPNLDVFENMFSINSSVLYSTGAAKVGPNLYLEGTGLGQCLSRVVDGVRTDVVNTDAGATCEVISSNENGVFFRFTFGGSINGLSPTSNIAYYNQIGQSLQINLLPPGEYNFRVATKDYLVFDFNQSLVRLSKNDFTYQVSTEPLKFCNLSLFEENKLFSHFCINGDEVARHKILDITNFQLSPPPLNVKVETSLRQFSMGNKKILIGDIKKVNGQYHPAHVVIYDPVTGQID